MRWHVKSVGRIRIPSCALGSFMYVCKQLGGFCAASFVCLILLKCVHHILPNKFFILKRFEVCSSSCFIVRNDSSYFDMRSFSFSLWFVMI